MIAVLSADLLSSSTYSKELLDKVLGTLKSEFETIETNSKEASEFKIYRGDSFQGIIHKPASALKIALQLKTSINKIRLNKNKMSKTISREADMRCAIGIGTYDFKRESISESNGQAFQFSGRSLDEMKNNNRKTVIKTPEEEINKEFDTSLFLFDILSDKWSTAAAEVIYYLLKDFKETEIAEKIGVSQSAVNQRKKAAGWEAVAGLLERYDQLISQHFSNGE